MSRQAAYVLRARLDSPQFRAAFEGARKAGIRARAAASMRRSRWEGPGLAALDYLRGPAAQADGHSPQPDTRPAQTDASSPQTDANRCKPTIFSPGQCNTRSMSRPPDPRSGPAKERA